MLKPLLEAKVNNSWVSPLETKDRQGLLDSYLIGWGAAQAVNEILNLERQSDSTAQALQNKRDNEKVDNFKIGA